MAGNRKLDLTRDFVLIDTNRFYEMIRHNEQTVTLQGPKFGDGVGKNSLSHTPALPAPQYSGGMFMKLIQIICPHCGAPLMVDQTMGQAVCEYCGMTTLVEHEPAQSAGIDSEQAGYDFEKGRQRAQAELARQTVQPRQTYTPAKPKKRHTFWWVMGCFIFPIPATILIVRNRKMHWIWGLYFILAMAA